MIIWTRLVPTMMSVAKIYFEIIKKASDGVFELFVKAVSI